MGALEPILIHDLLSVCLKPIERDLADRKVRIVRQIDRTSPEVCLDREQVRLVVVSLLAEAAAATVDGGRLRVCLKHNRAAVMLSIKDQGEGLTAEQRVAILKDASRPACQGAPLTIPECREAVAGMGGSLFVNSTPGRGTTWYATFPPPKNRAF